MLGEEQDQKSLDKPNKILGSMFYSFSTFLLSFSRLPNILSSCLIYSSFQYKRYTASINSSPPLKEDRTKTLKILKIKDF